MNTTKENRGLTVQINLWPPDNGAFNKEKPNLSIRGQVRLLDRKGIRKRWFKTPEELNAILVDWNIKRYEELTAKRRL
jgi:hypothetical protein